jgi:predicted MPP superfamily phosphohydrolase
MNRFIQKCNKEITTAEYSYYTARGACGTSFRIVQVSDLQSEYFGERQIGLLRAVERCRPDIIVITGDLVDRSHTDYLAAELAVKGLVNLAPVYYVNGNHEADLPGTEAADLYRTLEKHGVHVLMDSGRMLELGGMRVNIAGLSEYTLFQARRQQAGTGHRTKKSGLVIPAVVRQIRCAFGDRKQKKEVPGALRILLAHEPQYLRYYSAGRPDLIFSGHAHGGQFCLPGKERRGVFAPDQGVFPKLTSGCHRFADSTMYISRGLGNSSFPLRLNNPPEIVCVEVIGTAE